jgi:rod shape-determining protein MreC
LITGNPGAGTKIFGSAAQTARLMLYGLLAVVLMAMDQRGHYVPRIRSMAEYLVEPVYHVMEWPVRAMRNLFGQFQSRRSLRHENDDLRQRLLGQQGALQRLETVLEENRRLRALIDGAEGQTFEFQFAELVQVDLDPFSHKVMVDRGSNDGVQIGQVVIDGAGVMGQVEDVHPHFSEIRLISDPNHALPVQINRTGLRTVAFGTGDTGALLLPSVPRQADVREGDLVVTSGLGNRFPGGYPVAVVSRVNRDEGLTFVQVEATPLAALDRGREVLLIRTPDVPLLDDEMTGEESLPSAENEGETSTGQAEMPAGGQAPADEGASTAAPEADAEGVATGSTAESGSGGATEENP